MIKSLISVVVSILLVATASASPPYLSGQLVVKGSPSDFPGQLVIKHLPNAGLTVLATTPGEELRQRKNLRNRGVSAGLNFIAHKSFTVNDPLRSFQWHFDAVQANQAWDVSNGNGVIVAVLDSGMASNMSDGVNCITPGYDMVNGDANPEDGDGHGTHVAGTIAQTSNNATGVAGLAFGACIMPVKVLDDSGSGSFADIADGIYFAVNNGAAVINMSLGINARFGVTNDSIMDPALDYAYANGVTVVAASGNDGHRKNVSYPAIYPTVIAVGATDFRDQVTRYSNKGTGLDMVAPGGDTGRDDNRDGYGDGVLQETRISSNSAEEGYYFFQGTSMASPHVAAAAAMLTSHGISGPDAIFARLTATSKDIGDTGFDSSSGFGLLQVYDALTGTVAPPPPPPGGDDADGDGYTVEDGDCDDNNPDVYPGHNDSRGRWGRDGIDNDCNGVIDG